MIVLQIHNRYLTRGGEDESREAEVRVLREHGHRVIEYVESNERVAALGGWRTALRALWSIESFRKADALIRREKPDVMVVHNFFPLVSPSIYYAARRHGIPVVQFIHNYRLFCPGATFFRGGRVCELCLGRSLATPGIRYRCYHEQRSASAVVALMSAVHRAVGTWRLRVDRYVAVSEFARRKCVEGGLPSQKLMVKPNFVHPDPGAGDGRGGFILFVGRVAPEKGLDTLIDAWLLLKKPAPLKIIGEGPEASRLRARTLGRDGVEWLGLKSMAETLAVMGEAAVLVLPSEWYETFGRVAIEAYAKGTPVIASRLGAVEELVEDGRTGFLFTAGDAVAMADRLQVLLAMGEVDRAAMRNAARQAYEARYTAERDYDAFMELLTDVARRSVPGAGRIPS
jgi:glycosyltransferase involved in cell wall biosynthesis